LDKNDTFYYKYQVRIASTWIALNDRTEALTVLENLLPELADKVNKQPREHVQFCEELVEASAVLASIHGAAQELPEAIAVTERAYSIMALRVSAEHPIMLS
jgi:hypothetical protein